MRARRLETLNRIDAPLFPTRGQIVGWKPDQGILVQLAGGGVVLAQSLVQLDEAELQRAAAERRVAMLTFEAGDPERPVILGLLAREPARARNAPAQDDVVVVRGRESIELRCGAASITLRKDGKVVLRGTTIISRATEENQIAGGTVTFN